MHIILNIASPLPRSQFRETSEALSLFSLFLSFFSKEGFKVEGFVLHKIFQIMNLALSKMNVSFKQGKPQHTQNIMT